MALTLTVLGCSGSYPGPAGAASGYLVRGAGATLWVDAGSGSLANLQRHVGLEEVDAIVLTHEHPDHMSDIEGYRVACQYAIERTGVPVYAPAGVLARLSGDPEPAFDWRTVADGDAVEMGGLSLRFSRTDHPPETLAVRVDGEGRTLVYTSDTGPGWSLAALGHGVDVALSEATYLGDREGLAGHLSARQAGSFARAANAGRLLLTHVWPVVDPEASRAEAEPAYGGPVDVARLHETYEI